MRAHAAPAADSSHQTYLQMMKHTRAAAALALAAALSACADALPSSASSAAAAPAASSAPDAAGRYLVLFNGAVPHDFAARVQALGGSVTFAHGDAGLGAVAGLDDAAATQLSRAPGIHAVRADELLQSDPLPNPWTADEGDAAGAADAPASASLAALSGAAVAAVDPTRAPLFGNQWNLRAVGAHHAWAAGVQGSPSVRVAILDTGIGYTHPDLAALVDLSLSRSFIPEEDARVAGLFPGAHPVADAHYHGTHVAAIVSSRATLVAGVTSRTTLVGLKVCHAGSAPVWRPDCRLSAVLQALVYAADQGLDVANLSLALTFRRPDVNGGLRDGPALAAALARAMTYANRKGMTVVVAAGNSSVNLDHDGGTYQAYCNAPGVICVSGTGPTRRNPDGSWAEVDAPAYFTNFGRSVIDVAAPAGNTGAAIPSACSPFSQPVPTCGYLSNKVLFARGTSMAAPHVSGLAALLVERHGRNPARIRALIQQSADDLGEPGTDPYYGQGRLNIPRALGLAGH